MPGDGAAVKRRSGAGGTRPNRAGGGRTRGTVPPSPAPGQRTRPRAEERRTRRGNALEHVSEQPLDLLLLGLLALGLFAYSAWRLVEGLADLDDVNGGFRGWALRASVVAVGLTYLAFGAYAVALLLGMRVAGDGVEEDALSVYRAVRGGTGPR